MFLFLLKTEVKEVRIIFRNWNRGILDFFGDLMEWMVGMISNLLTMSPQAFSPDAFAVSQVIGTGLAPFAVYIMIILWGIDFLGSALSFSDKPLESLVRLVFMLGMGIVFTHVSFFLVMGLFSVFGSIITGMADMTGMIDFSAMTDNTRAMIDEQSGLGLTSWSYEMGNTENMILFVFLVFSMLSFFGMFLGMILVPIAIFVELYIYAAFSPIPIATLFTGQKQVGISFIKLVISVCLRGALVLFGINIAFHILASDLFSTTGVFELTGFWRFLGPVITISISIMILQKCIKGAETFAKQITGATGS